MLKSKDITLLTKFHLVNAMVFPVVMCGYESWIIKKAEHPRTVAFELWIWRKFWESFGLKGDQTSQSYRKSLQNIHWKDWCWSWTSNTLATWCEELTHLKRPWCWERLKVGEAGDDRRWDVWGWHHWLDGHELKQALGVDDRQGSLVCCSPWGHKVRHNWATELIECSGPLLAWNRTSPSCKLLVCRGDPGCLPWRCELQLAVFQVKWISHSSGIKGLISVCHILVENHRQACWETDVINSMQRCRDSHF